MEPRRDAGEVRADLARGLDAAAVARALREHGPNLLPEPERRHARRILLGLLTEPMLLLLIAAAVVYLILGDADEAVLLAISVAAVAAITLYQELRSEHALQALRELSSPRARLRRDGAVCTVAAREVVPGDVMLLAEGDRIAADALLLDDADLRVDESLLSGESEPQRRSAGAPDPDARRVQAGTLVVGGRGTARVLATGAHTAIGRIGQSLRTITPERTPMQREMRRAVALFAAIGLASCVLVVVLHVATYGRWLEALLAGITLAISNIPEEFPLVMTVFLALGAWRMARQHALVRRAAAVETLGAVTVLCTDKTGTLTENRMRVAELQDEPTSACAGPEVRTDSLQALRRTAALACPPLSVDPMERAIIDAAGADWSWPAASPLREYGLDARLLAHTQVWASSPDAAPLRVACKGAPEAVATLCRATPSQRDAWLRQADAMAARGLRVLAVAAAEGPQHAGALPASPREFAFRWLGLVGLADPLRAGAAEAVADAREAGVRVMMLTGDHVGTARAIARQAGIDDAAAVVSGTELDTLADAALQERAVAGTVFARVRPEHKLRLVRALRDAGHVVAMTGDGVNDAPALAAAHVGIAMGGRGTDVAREAAAIVLLDDDFSTVVRAIRLGRVIYDNIRRAVRYILAVHVPITGMVLLPLLLGDPVLLLPLHIVFLELIIDPACAIVFEREPADPEVMRRPPRPTSQRLLDGPLLATGLGQGGILLAAVASTWLLARAQGLDAAQLACVVFVALVVGNLGLIALNRSGGSLLRGLLQPNAAWVTVGAGAALLLLAIVFVPWLRQVFGFAPPPSATLAAAVLFPLAGLIVLDAIHRLLRRRSRAGSASRAADAGAARSASD